MQNIDFNSNQKSEIFEQVKNYLQGEGYQIITQDQSRPWGGFFVIDEGQIQKFKDQFFPEVELDKLQLSQKLSPKILLVAPDKRLSWQYHHRRAEIWKLVKGNGGIVTSDTDEQGELKDLKIGEVVKLKQGERHRLVGLKEWGMVAEIWMHADPSNPSDEEDIVRVEDDFNR
ncbi:phosphoheptose isomerase [Litoribacter alkaliphilus]|uniref:Phosphoheptose isomerase n=1 Tax=Litoribacter ruber TaxID=702568 RepID=A0AAP2G1T6_9BACT|nr:phosphoheptose isomerase [Litoribacter alkaliphilus]MBS9524707.1 phosphoheptose isomerase [Litoribacter alkaliphilus]